MIDVLFVDDEREVLEGLSHRLRGFRRQWRMRFCRDAAMAMGELSRERADVVVSDVRMPGVDGAAFFRNLRDQHPTTARIALTGQTDRQTLLRVLGLAHQYLSKPCSGDALYAAVMRSCRLRDVSADEFDAVLRSGCFPVEPSLHGRLTTLVESGDASLDDVAALVEQDASTTARLLQLVNSAWFHPSREIVDVREAVKWLGLEAVRAVVLSVGLFEARAPKRVTVAWLGALRDHSLEVAMLAARLVRGEHQRLAFTAGVLHEVGAVLLAEAGLPVDQAPLIGARLLALWGLPDTLVEAVALQRQPSAASTQAWGALGALHVADALSTPRELDLPFLEAAGVMNELEKWRTLARRTEQ